jgi:hypothetical protein
MFFLTLFTETSALRMLYKHDGLSWKRSLKISSGINLSSYLSIFLVQILFIATFFGCSSIVDKQFIKKGGDSHLLDDETGYIYTVEDTASEKYARYVIKRYEVVSKSWSTIDLGPERGINPMVWDVKGDIVVCIIETEDLENRTLSIFSGPEYILISQIKGNPMEVRIAPDLEKIAVLEYVSEAVAPKDSKGHFMLGPACRLKIYEIKTGKLLHEAADLTLSQGLCWTNDSRRLCFTSLRDKKLFDYREGTLPPIGYGTGFGKIGQFPIDLFVFDPLTNSIRTITEGIDPRNIASTGSITFLREKGYHNCDLWMLDPKTGEASVIVKGIQNYRHAVSPSGKSFLIQILHKYSFWGDSSLTIIDPKDSSRKFILKTSSLHDFRWVQ